MTDQQQETIRESAARGGLGSVDAIRLEALLALTRMTESTIQEISDRALSAAVEITQSRIGYLAFASEDEAVLTMYAWSAEAMAECAVPNKTHNYPVEGTGLWGEAMRQRRAIITNDYAGPNPFKRGVPVGHVRIRRHMNLPVFHGERIVAVLGVGNKETNYSEDDVRQLTLLTQEMWNLILRKRDQEKLREREELYRMLFESSLLGFVLTTGHQAIDCNEQTCRMLGCTREEIMGRSALDFSPPAQPDGRDSLEIGNLRLAATLSGQDQTFYWRYLRKDGRPLDTMTSLKAISRGGQGLVLATLEDITERKRAEEERRKLEAQMQHTQKLESLGVLAGGIAHDFNNMLMAILGNADLAMMQLTDLHPARAMLEEIEKASKRAADLCRQMLAYSGRGKFVVRRIDLSQVIEEMAHMLEVSVSKKAALCYDLARNLPPVAADVTQVRQILMNVVVNASEAIGDRHGTISIATGTMHCDRAYLDATTLGEEALEGQYTFLEVSDTGCGMSPETVNKIFDPFFTTKFTGRGLGLAAVLGIVRGHKGTIKVYSESGRGTTFKALFPSLPAMEKAADEPLARPAENWRHGATILLVDDEDYIRDICRKMLEHLGLTVLTARHGREALEIYQAYHDQIGCVLLDLTMPQMDGEETFRELRRIDGTVRVILSSGYTEQEVSQRFMGKGLAGFIQKPFQSATLVAELKKVFEGKTD